MQKDTIGWIGTGVMGLPMCMHILDAGYAVYVHTRTQSKAAPLIGKGAHWCGSVADVARSSGIIFTMLGFPREVEEVLLGNEGVLSQAKAGSLVVDMSTSSPALAVRIHSRALNKGIQTLDAPVSGGDVGAREARLAVMVGGERAAFDRVLPLFETLGKNISYMGGPGSGQHTKLANQISIASTMVGVVECLHYAYKAGPDLASVIDVIGSGAASSWSLNNLGRRIVNDDFKPGFFIKHFIKDMDIALEEARRMNLNMPGLSLAARFYKTASEMGLKNQGTQALYKVFERMNNDAPSAWNGKRS
jgi:3-hydroxyisobutyrate dehydrogenase